MAAGKFQLISEAEYRAQLAAGRPDFSDVYQKSMADNSLHPKISVASPDLATKLVSPTDIKINFESFDKAKIDINSLEVLYGWLSLDITDRIKEHADLNASGILAKNVELPSGEHLITIQIKDSKGRGSKESFTFEVK